MVTRAASNPVLTADQTVPPNRRISVEKKDFLIIVGLCIVLLLSWVPRLRGPIDLRWDAGVYYVLGTSLAQGHGYRLLNEPGNIQAIQYPPGLPAVVAAYQLLARTDDPVRVGTLLRWSWCLLSMLYVALVFLLSRRFLPRPYAALATLACLFNYQMLFLSTLCFAELPFACMSVLFGWLYLRKQPVLWTKLGAALAAVGCYLLRTAGIALLLAWIADAVLKRHFRQAVLRTGVALIPIACWQLYIHSVESSAAYKHPSYEYQRAPWVFYNVSYATNVALKYPFRPEQGFATHKDLALRFASNLVTMPAVLGESVSAKRGFWVGHLKRLNGLSTTVQLPDWSIDVVLVPLGLIVIAGCVWMLWRREWFVPIYVLLMVAAICTTVWPGQFTRYLAPLEPYALLAFFTVIIEVRKVARERFPLNRILRTLPIAVVVLVAGESAISSVVGFRNFRDSAIYQDAQGVDRTYTLLHYPGAASAAEPGFRWLAAHADRRAIVAVSMPQYVYLKTGLKAVMPPLEAKPEEAQHLVDSVPITYMALDRLLMEDNFNRRFPTLMRAYPEKWRLVFESPGHQFDIYERVGTANGSTTNHVALPPGKSVRF